MNKYTLCVNDTMHEIQDDSATPLVYILRNHLSLTGTKIGCAQEQCGTCSVLVDGECIKSCVRRGSEFEGCKITTVEGLDKDGELSPVQQAFVAENAAQCGYCTPGLVIATTALLSKNANPSYDEIIEVLNGNLCRCGSHARVFAAIEQLVTDSI